MCSVPFPQVGYRTDKDMYIYQVLNHIQQPPIRTCKDGEHLANHLIFGVCMSCKRAELAKKGLNTFSSKKLYDEQISKNN